MQEQEITQTPINVLFVCLGNICRSPLAQGILERLLELEELGQDVRVDSCGTAAFNLGKKPDARAIEAARSAGYDIGNQVARIISPSDFDHYQFVIAMDNINLMHVRALAPENYRGEIALFRHYSQRGGNLQIADPYYDDANHFDALIPELEQAARGLLAYIKERL